MSRDVIMEDSLELSNKKVSIMLVRQQSMTKQLTHLVELDLFPDNSKGTISIDITEKRDTLLAQRRCPKCTVGSLNLRSRALLHFSHFSTNWDTLLVQSKIRALRGPRLILFSVLI